MMYTKRSIVFFVSITLSICQAQDHDGCRRSAAGFNQCVVDQMNTKQSNIKQGFPHLKIGTLDPLCVPKIVLKQGSGPVSIDLTSTDQIFRGISNYKITSAKIDLKSYKMEFTASLPWLFVEGDTKMEGKILALSIKGHGDSWSNYTIISAKAVLTGHPTQRGGKEYFSLDDLKFNMDVKAGTVHLNNLFSGNQQLGDAMNKVMSDNWDVVYEELRPVVEQTAAALVKDIAGKVLNYYSLDDMFPK